MQVQSLRRSLLPRAFLVVAMFACCATRGKGFLPPVPSYTPASSYGAGRVDRQWTPRSYFFNPHTSNTDRHVRRRPWRDTAGMCTMMAAASGQTDAGRGTQVVLLRHGMSTFNKLNIFTGWCDVPLAEEGKTEALEAGKLLAAAGYRLDVAHSSVLKRACTSLHRLLDGCGQPYIPIKTSWRLNERHYGALQGRNKASLEKAMGDIVVEWRRGYSVRPPPMTDTHPHWPLLSLDSRYRGLTIPESESLRDTADRVMEYWESDVVPDIRAGKRVIVVAHANTLRSLVKRLDGVEEDAIRNVNIPTGEPFVYNFDADLRPVGEPDEHGFRGRFIGDMMAEKDAAVDEYKRREQACFDKWEENPEIVPEECICEDDVIPNADQKVAGGRFGEAQASLGLDRYSVGYDLPLPSFFEAAAPSKEVEVGGPVLETLADLPNPSQKQAVGGGEEGGRCVPGV